LANQLSLPAAPTDSTWTDLLIESSATSGGTYAQIKDLAYTPSTPTSQYWDEQGGATTWYRYRWYDSVNVLYSPYCPVFQVDSTTTFYTTPAKVATLIQSRTSQGFVGFDGITRPTIGEVIQMIQQCEDRIDYETGHAWRTRFSQTQSGLDTASSQYELYEQSDISYVQTGVRVNLRHRSILNFDNTQGDAFQCWNGNAWQDFLTTTTMGRGNDWWIDNEKGTLWILNFIGSNFNSAVQVKYRYGEPTVPGDITQAATYMVACMLAESDDRSFLIPDGGDHIVLDKKVQIWERNWKEIVFHRAESRVYGG
jgi:hypothetical protein